MRILFFLSSMSSKVHVSTSNLDVWIFWSKSLSSSLQRVRAVIALIMCLNSECSDETTQMCSRDRAVFVLTCGKYQNLIWLFK